MLPAVAIDTVGVGLFLPLSLLYFKFTTDVPIRQVGLAMSIATFVAMPTGLLGGMLVDRIGERAIMVGNNILSAIGYSLYIFADGTALIFIGTLLIGVANRAYWACWPPYVTRIAGREGFHQWFAFLEATKSACMAAGAFAGGLILASGADASGARFIVVCNVVTSLVAAALFSRQPVITNDASADSHQAATERPPTWLSLLRQRRYLLPLVAQSFAAPTWLLASVALPVHYVVSWGLPGWLPSVLFAVGNVLIFVAQTPAAHTLRYWPKERIIAVSTGCVCASMVLLTTVDAWHDRPKAVADGTTIIVAIIIATAYLLYTPAAYAISMGTANDRTRGRAAAMFDVGTAVAAAAGPAVMGALVLSHPAWLWWGIGLGAAIAQVCFSVNARNVEQVMTS
jgi:MFS family permease